MRGKGQQNAKNLRIIQRQKLFQISRKLDYLKFYDAHTKAQIIESTQAIIPKELPLLSKKTISYYRRSNLPVFKTRQYEQLQLDPHMTYQSLWILAGLQESQYGNNYNSVVKQFQRDLGIYLSAESNEIKQMATIAAGNKIIGKQADILNIVTKNSGQLWVLINHIYEKKISFTTLFKFIKEKNEFAYRTIYQLTNNHDEQIAAVIVQDEDLLTQILNSLKDNNIEIKKYALRIIGNILAEKEEYVSTLQAYKLLNYIFQLLMSSSQQIVKDTCWLLTNFAFQRNSATQLLRNTQIMEKLIQLFQSGTNIKIKEQITHIFSFLVNFADKLEAFKLFANERFLELCHTHLCIAEIELNSITLLLISKLIDLGQDYKTNEDRNLISQYINRNIDLKNEIQKKTFSQDSNISSYSLHIKDLLDEEDEISRFGN